MRTTIESLIHPTCLAIRMQTTVAVLGPPIQMTTLRTNRTKTSPSLRYPY